MRSTKVEWAFDFLKAMRGIQAMIGSSVKIFSSLSLNRLSDERNKCSQKVERGFSIQKRPFGLVLLPKLCVSPSFSIYV